MCEIGQQVVCVKTHSMGAVKEGQIHTTQGIKVCDCGNLTLDVGVRDNGSRPYLICTKCNRITKTPIWWINAVNFRPLDDLYNTEIEELMNEVNEKQPFEA